MPLLAWVALVPLFFALDGQNPLRAFKRSYCAGAVFFLGSIYWLIHVTLSGMIGLALYLALFFGVFALLAGSAISRPSYLSLLVIPSAWVACEYARSHLLGGFGWNLLAHSQSPLLPMIQIADITGAYGVSFLIVLANTALFFTIKDIRNKNFSTFYLAVTLAVLFISAGYGIIRVNNIFMGERARIAVVQGNIPQKQKWDPVFREMIMKRYEALTRDAAREYPNLIIWPESSVPGFLTFEQDLFDRVSGLAKESGAALLVGTPRQESGNSDAYYNSATLFSEDGRRVADYDKLHLVPFGEYIPAKGVFSFVEKFTKSTIGDFSPGKEYMVFNFFVQRSARDKDHSWRLLKKIKFSTLICFEDIFPDLARQFVKKGAGFLVAITNDAWFGQSSAPYQHAQSSVFRAVENRVNVVRAANTGLSCFIDQRGRITASVGLPGNETFVEGFKVEDIVLTNARTLYTVYGDVFAYLCIAVALLSAIVSLPVKRKPL